MNMPRKGWAGIPLLVFGVMVVAACGSSPSPPHMLSGARSPSGTQSAAPAEFRAACGHPGASVTVRKVPVTIRHADCDLSGVAISYPGRGGATVPRGGGGEGIGNSMGFTLTVDPGTLDVTINVTGAAGNA